MTEPKIHSLVQAPLLGQLGEKARVVEPKQCPACGQRPPLEVSFLHYEFDYWNGEPFVYVANQFAVTPELRRVIEDAKMVGVSFRDMLATYGHLDDSDDEELAELPKFSQLIVEKRLPAGPGWWIPAGRCSACGWTIWKDGPSTIRAIVHAHRDKDLPVRTVLRADYSGEDIFYLDDPGPAVITERFRSLLEANGVAELGLQQARFIDSA